MCKITCNEIYWAQIQHVSASWTVYGSGSTLSQVGNILVHLLLFCYYRFVYSTFLLLFASICSIVIKFWFTKAFVEVWGVFIQGTSTDIIWCTNTKIKVSLKNFLEAFLYETWSFGGYSWHHMTSVQAKREKTKDNSRERFERILFRWTYLI